ncbi:MAG: hypothetical protein V7750_18260 [Sneathiella sp.]
MASCTYSVSNKNTSGDNLNGAGIFFQPFIDYAWNICGFSGNKNYWDDRFDQHDACNASNPMPRAFNACWLLAYSSTNY